MIPLNVYCRFILLMAVKKMFVYTQQTCAFQLPDSPPFYVCSDLDCTEGETNSGCSEICTIINGTTNSKILMEIIDEEKGRLEVKYNVHNNLRFNKFDIELRLNKNHMSDECSSLDTRRFSVIKNFVLHSSRTVQVDWCNDPRFCPGRCRNAISVIFDHVYSGCYLVTISIYNQSVGYDHALTKSTSCARHFNTSYFKKPLVDEDMTPRAHPQYLTGSANLLVYPKGNPEAISIKFSAKRKAFDDFQDQVCTKNIKTQSCCVFDRLAKNNDNEFQCENLENSSIAGCAMRTSSDPEIEEVIFCEFKDVNPGNYCVNIEYNDDRCRTNTVWSDGKTNYHPCHWIIPISAPPYILKSLSPFVEPPKMTTILAAITIFIAFLIILILIIIKFLYLKNPTIITRDDDPWPTRIVHNIRLFKLGSPKVLLLYPRDCAYFMEAMAKFREVLKRANCEVFDCWDPEQYNKVASCPNAWIQFKIDKSDQVIVVASDCSRLLEKNVVGNETVSYLTPQCFDELFLYGLQFLHQTSLTDCYEKIYVVSLRGRQNNNGLAYINPLTVFSLPVHLEKLILSLHRFDGTNYSLAMEIPEVIELKSAIDNFSRFRLSHPNYLDNIIRVITI